MFQLTDSLFSGFKAERARRSKPYTTPPVSFLPVRRIPFHGTLYAFSFVFVVSVVRYIPIDLISDSH
jgi:hypothetical protein